MGVALRRYFDPNWMMINPVQDGRPVRLDPEQAAWVELPEWACHYDQGPFVINLEFGKPPVVEAFLTVESALDGGAKTTPSAIDLGAATTDAVGDYGYTIVEREVLSSEYSDEYRTNKKHFQQMVSQDFSLEQAKFEVSPWALHRLKKILGASHRGSLTFFNNFAVLPSVAPLHHRYALIYDPRHGQERFWLPTRNMRR
jgi:hypothetical protein